MAIHFWQGTWQGRLPAGDQHCRSRQVVRPTGGIVRGKFPSRKNGRMVHYEGLLELDAIYQFETSPRIVRYREQLPTVSYPDGGRLRRYTPDFELILVTGEAVLVEVKPLGRLRDPEIQHKLGCISAHFERSGIRFMTLSENVLRLEPLRTNLRTVFHSAPRIPIAPGIMLAAIERFGSRFPMSIGEASSLLDGSGVDPYSLLLNDWLRCALDKAISAQTVLNLVGEDGDAWFCIAHQYGF